eukprot:5375117-Prymnesium_polylepis.1
MFSWARRAIFISQASRRSGFRDGGSLELRPVRIVLVTHGLVVDPSHLHDRLGSIASIKRHFAERLLQGFTKPQSRTLARCGWVLWSWQGLLSLKPT